MDNIVATLVVVLILGGAIFYIVRAKKKGVKCIGCPDSTTCVKKTNEQSCCCGCSGCSYKDSCPSKSDSEN